MTSTAVRTPAAGLEPDPGQRVALEHRGPVLRVLGGPGTGKSWLAIELVVGRVRRGEARADECLVIAPTRRAAARLRDGVTRRLGVTTREPLARTVASFAFGVLRRAAVRDDLPTPFLLSGAEQDAVLRELLAGHGERPELAPVWPEHLHEALGTHGFRGELRDLLMRAVEHGLDADALAELGEAVGRPEWVAAASVLGEYDQVTALARPGAFDPSWLLAGAADTLAADPELLTEIAAGLRLMIVDDAQEIGAPAARLLRLLAGAGVSVVLIGDPDAAVQTFRGADPAYLATGWRELGHGAEVVLREGHRIPQALREPVRRVAELVGALGGGAQRSARSDLPGGTLDVHVFRSAAQEATYIVDAVRRAHLLDGLPWHQMAVVVRGQGRSDVIRRHLAAAHVPVAHAESDLPLREEDAVRPLLALIRCATQRLAHRAQMPVGDLSADPDAGWRLTPEVAVDLLTSPYGGADALTLRRLRRNLRRCALDEGAGEAGEALLARALARPGELADLGPEAAGARRIARMLHAATSALGGSGHADTDAGGVRPPATAQQVLWALWDASGVAEDWRATALAGGRAGARADRDLDAVIAVLGAAEDFAQRLPGLGPAAFTDQMLGQDVAADSVVARAADRERVAVLTPHAAAGREWDLVFVAGVQEGVWPDLRLRGSLLGSEDLVDALAGRERSVRASQAAVRHDEARLFHVAVTRARRHLHVSAVRDTDDMPSAYLDVVDPAGPARPAQRPATEVATPLTLVGLLAANRRLLATLPTTPEQRSARSVAAATVAHLSRAGVRGAHPSTWWGLRHVSDDGPRVATGEPVPVSPSALVGFGRCQLNWLLTRSGGEGPAIGSAALGTLIHEVLADDPDGENDADHLAARLEQGFPRLGLGHGWTARAKKAQALDMLARAVAYTEHARQQGWRREAVELPFRATIGRARLSGVVDRLERDASGRVRIIDYKTGSAKPSLAEIARHPQLGAYQLAAAEGAFGDAVAAGAALVQLGKAGGSKVETSVQAQPPLASDPEPHWAHRMLSDAAEGMAGSRVLATIGEACRTCPVAGSCPARADGSRVV